MEKIDVKAMSESFEKYWLDSGWAGYSPEHRYAAYQAFREAYNSLKPQFDAALAEHRSQIAALEHLVHEARLGAAQHEEEIEQLKAEIDSVANYWTARFTEFEAERDALRAALGQIKPEQLESLCRFIDKFDEVYADNFGFRPPPTVQDDLRKWADTTRAALAGRKEQSND